MSAALRGRSARARATSARDLTVNNKTGHFGRAFSDCFERGDGEEVVRLLVARLAWDGDYRAAVLRHAGSMPVAVLKAAHDPQPRQKGLFS